MGGACLGFCGFTIQAGSTLTPYRHSRLECHFQRALSDKSPQYLPSQLHELLGNLKNTWVILGAPVHL